MKINNIDFNKTGDCLWQVKVGREHIRDRYNDRQTLLEAGGVPDKGLVTDIDCHHFVKNGIVYLQAVLHDIHHAIQHHTGLTFK